MSDAEDDLEIVIAERDILYAALSVIANGSPAMFLDQNSVERRCSLCAAHIGVAREALRWQPLPSEGGVPLQPSHKGSHVPN